MKKNYLSYSDMINYFGENKISDRYKYIYDKMLEYIRVRGFEDRLTIHEGLLQQAVMDYFVDLYRMKEFHKIDRTDMTKILSYEVYWILRRKPIVPSSNETDSRIIFANEGFVTTLIAHEFLLSKDGDEIEPMLPEEEDVLIEFLQNMNYHFKYRTVDKHNIELMLYAFLSGKVVRR